MKSDIRRLVAGALLCAGTGHATAAGFAIIEHGAQGMGNAFAGGGAVAEDASTVWFNPASMSRLGSQLLTAGHLLVPSFEFTNQGSTSLAGRPLLSGIGGGTAAGASNDGGQLAVVPNFFYVREINDRWSFGLAINAPFGLATEYDSNWVGRYQAIESEIINLNANPALSYKVNDNLSVGAGLSANYANARLTRAIDFTAVCLSRAGALAGCVGAPNLGQGLNDGAAEVKGDDISFGFNLGLMVEFNENSRLALAFRSEIKHDLDGKATFQVPSRISASAAADSAIRSAFQGDSLSASLRLPASFSVSAYHRFNASKFAVMGDATWTEWSSVPGILIIYDNPATAGGPTSEPLGWENVWRVGLGLNYYHNDRLTLRTGVAYDQSPIPNQVLRTPRLPGNDRTWLSFGASYRINDRMSADLGYAHLFIDDTPINHSDPANGTLRGTYKSDVNIFSAQFNYRFD